MISSEVNHQVEFYRVAHFRNKILLSIVTTYLTIDKRSPFGVLHFRPLD